MCQTFSQKGDRDYRVLSTAEATRWALGSLLVRYWFTQYTLTYCLWKHGNGAGRDG